MADKDQIQSSIKEAEIYQKQGLLNESKEKYQEILKEVNGDEDLSKDQQLINLLDGRLLEVESSLGEIDGDPDVAELSEEVQDLISELFSFSRDENTAAVESAMALATFGQYEKALSELQSLLDKRILPLDVAKNMLQCHISLGSHEAAVSQFKEWISQKTFPDKELNRLGEFLENILGRDGIKADLPRLGIESPNEEIATEEARDISEEDVTEILSVKILFDDGPYRNRTRDFDVKFQLGNSVTIDIESNEKDLLSFLETGVFIPKVQCYSSFYFFNSKATVSGKNRVTAGPKQGDYSIALSLESP